MKRNQPTAAEIRSLTCLLAGYMATDGARVTTQQQSYSRYFRKFSALEAKYPAVDFRSDASQAGLIKRARARLGERVMRWSGAAF